MKATKMELYGRLLEVEEIADNEVYVAFIKNEMELLRRRSEKSSKSTEENDKIRNVIYEAMEEGRAYTTTEIRDEILGELGASIQKVNGLLTVMKRSGRIVRTEEKGKAYFMKA